MRAYVGSYCLSRDVSKGYAFQLRNCVDKFGEFLGREAQFADLTDDTVNRYLAWMIEQGFARETIAGRRRMLKTIWLEAFADSLVSQPPRKLRPIRTVDRVIDGYLREDMLALIATAKALPGNFRGTAVPRAGYWSSLLPAKWESTLRLGDILTFERAFIQPGGFISIVQNKTGRIVRRKFSSETLSLIDSFHDPARRHIWGIRIKRRQWFRAFKQLASLAGVGGTSRWIRRGSASYCERERPGAGPESLGHSSPRMFYQHYKVDKICAAEPTEPPSLWT